eukprot:TRINITY_DN13250_c2_g1_i1.p1 TRINITY_DN13250_c2_g1~~TRINITY_DN13250_c2_g1_i1.p1  ORF type:complete len:491 (+),score=51.63 TRINITY_DN13250_c2_g1_i1:147-1475(+)
MFGALSLSALKQRPLVNSVGMRACADTSRSAAKKEEGSSWREDTRAVHSGEPVDPHTRASSAAINMSTTFSIDKPMGFSIHGLPEEAPFVYSRWANPTVKQLEQKLVALERGAAGCATFASGMGAASALLFGRLGAGSHLVISDVSYAGVAELVRHTLPRFGVDVTFVDASSPSLVAGSVRDTTKMIWIETPANPIMRLADIRAVADISRSCGADLVVDGTFSTPIITSPLELGADFVMHSLTKYISGHGDCLGGAVLGADVDKVQELVSEASVHFGATLSPFNAWLIMRGAATLPVRMRAHSQKALKVARFLESHPGVKQVRYPGLPSHPQHALAARQMRDGMYSGMLQFQVHGGLAGGEAVANKMMTTLSTIHYAVSLGHARSLVFFMPTDDLNASSFGLTGDALEAYRESAGDGIFRLSVGLEDADDIIEDLDRVLPPR